MVARKNIVRNVVTSTALAGMMFASPVVSEAALGDQTLSYGEKHGDVVELQDVLSAKGYFNYDVGCVVLSHLCTAEKEIALESVTWMT